MKMWKSFQARRGGQELLTRWSVTFHILGTHSFSSYLKAERRPFQKLLIVAVVFFLCPEAQARPLSSGKQDIFPSI